jgi:phosphatidylserine/phosphatidylglycerophosphate/cardiolipin synthase-like enzyme
MSVDSSGFAALIETLWADGRLGRSGQGEIKRFLEETEADDHALGVYRHQAFELWEKKFGTGLVLGSLELLEETLKRLFLGVGSAESAPMVSEAYFSSIDDCVGVIIELFGRCRESVDICVFTITDDRISDSIVRAKRRGVTIRIVTDDDKAGDIGSDIERLASLGIETRQDRSERHMHHKFALFDREELLTGSYNWTRGAADRNMENIIITRDPRLLRAFTREFERLWASID